MNTATWPGIHRESVWPSIALSVLMIVAGVLAILVPQAAGITVNLLVGWLLLFSGIAHLAYAWETRGTGGILWNMLIGILYIAVSLYLLAHPIMGLVSLTLALAAFLFTESILEFVLAIRLRPAPGSGWLFVDGIITLLLSAMIGLTWPASSEWAIGTLIGVSILFGGIARWALSMSARRVLLRHA